MLSRTLRSGVGAAALAATALALAAVPAMADPSGTPSDTDLVGVGSDTSQFVVTNLANGATVSGSHVAGYNESQAAGAPRIASFDACTVPSGAQFPCTPGGNITLRSGTGDGKTIARPNGSGAGKSLLYGSGNNDYVTFARSSSALSTAEKNANLYAYPFAMDTLVMVTSKHTASHAPLNLTGEQILGIYTGQITSWNEIDSSRTGTIVPQIPQTGSGTRNFFIAQLTTLNGGVAPTLAPSVVEVQEHDPTATQDNADAIAPFSLGRANLAGTVRVEKGFSARRALYDVVRGSSTAHPEWTVGSDLIESVFGADGFACSPKARPLIEAAGFKQLESEADGGVCGVPTQDATSNLAIYDEDGSPSTTSVSVSPASPTFGASTSVTATISGAGGTASGSVTFTAGSFTQTVQLTSGSATVQLPANQPAGATAVKASYSGDDTFVPSDKTVAVTIAKGATKTKPTFPTSVAKGKHAVGKVAVAITPASTLTAKGTVTVKRGSTVVGSGTLTNGAVKLTLKALPKGKDKLVVVYAGSKNLLTSSKTIYITQK